MLLPFFFLAGLYVSLNFVLNDEDVGRVYGFDLTGAGVGALAVLGLMFAGAPVPAGARACWCRWRWRAAFAPARRWAAIGLALLALVGGEALLLLDDRG